MSQSSPSTGDGHGPWWESDISTVPPSLAESPRTQGTLPTDDPPAAETPTVEATVVDLTTRRPAAPPKALVASSGGITGRGTFLMMLAASAIGGLVGFVISGVTVIPPLTGYGLVIGSVVGALTCSPRLGWFPMTFPPLALFIVVLVLGQVTLLGTGFSATRELTMVLAALTAQAPAQLISVVAVGGILLIRRRRRR